MVLRFRQAQFELKPAIRFFPAHQVTLPQLIEHCMSLNTLAQFGTLTNTHWQASIRVGGHIGIAGRIAGTDAVGGGRIIGFEAVHHRCRAQERPGTAAGAFDVDSFHEILSLPILDWD